MIVAVRAILVAVPFPTSVSRDHSLGRREKYSRIFKLTCILPESFFALFADEGHVESLQQRVVGLLLVAFCAVEPFFAARRADGDLGVENVFTAGASGCCGGVAGVCCAVLCCAYHMTRTATKYGDEVDAQRDNRLQVD
jgi:hypothetical protein